MGERSSNQAARQALLREIGIEPIWQRREAVLAARSAQPAAPSAQGATDAWPTREQRIARLDWDELEADIRACRACGLCLKRRQAVPGVGDRCASWLVVGEAPGEQEDLQGEPFVGPAGRLLDQMLAAIGLRRGEGVYIANVIKCRPPGNRNPAPEEIAACLPYLRRQIELLQPSLILALGRFAAQSLLATEASVGSLRGQSLTYRLGERAIPLVVSYHPSYLLRSPLEKAKAWEDLLHARARYQASPDRASSGTNA